MSDNTGNTPPSPPSRPDLNKAGVASKAYPFVEMLEQLWCLAVLGGRALKTGFVWLLGLVRKNPRHYGLAFATVSSVALLSTTSHDYLQLSK